MSDAIIKVRGYHLDLYGHVNNARYLEFLEESRWAMIEEKIDLGELKKRGIGMVVVNINIDYKLPANLGDILRVTSTIDRIGTKSATIKQLITSEVSGHLIASALVTFVIIDIATQKVIAIDDDTRDLLLKFS
jgi:thioesterase-3